MRLNKILIHHIERVTPARKALSVIGVLIFVSSGCGSSSQTASSSETSSYYASGLGSFPVNDQIEDGFKSVRRIQNNTIYRSYFFPDGSGIREGDLPEMDLDALNAETSVETHSNAGTATVVFNDDIYAVLLTAAHTVSQPDTMVHFSETNQNTENPFVEGVSVKISENRFVITDYGIVTLDILSADVNKDLALLITASGYEARDQLQVLNIPAGDYDRVEWGSRVFAMGYPRGVQMVSAGVISLTSHPHRTFLADLNINRGFSGGIVSTVNSETGRMEWVGMITSAMGESLTYLIPDKTILVDYNPDIAYEGDLFIENHHLIHYGIGYGVSITDIHHFIQENETVLQREGIGLDKIHGILKSSSVD